MKTYLDRFLAQAILGFIVLLIILLARAVGAQALPPHLRTKPSETLNGLVARRIGTNLVVNVHTNVILYSAPVTAFRRVNGRMSQVVIARSEPIRTNAVTHTYMLIGYPNWRDATEGDRIRVQVVHAQGPGGSKLAYYAGRAAPKQTGRLLE